MRKLLLSINLVLIFSLLCAGCKSTNTHMASDIMRVSVILPHSDDEYWSKIEGSIKECLKVTAENGVDIKFYIPQINYNIDQMTQILNQQIAAKVDVIAVQGNENNAYADALKDAYNKGIHIICIDTDIPEFPDHLYIGTDNYQAGYSMGEHIVKEVGDTAKITIMSGEKGYPNLDERIRGLEEAFADYAGIVIDEILYDNYDGSTFMKCYNESGNDDTLVCIEGTAAQTITRMFLQRDGHFKHLFAFDVTAGIPAGIVDGIMIQDNRQMGKLLVSELLNLKPQGRCSHGSIYTLTTWVTKDNYESVVNGNE